MKISKTLFYGVLAITLLSCSLTFAEDTGSKDTGSKVLALVNGKEILKEEVDFFATPVIERAKAMGQEMTPELEAQLYDQWTNQLISRELLIQHAKKEKMVVSDEELSMGVAEAKQQGLNMPDADLNKVIKEELMIAKVIEEIIVPKIVVDDKEVEAFYNDKKDLFKQPDQVKASHILIKSTETDTPEVKKEQKGKIENILKEARSGDSDFGELAKKHSEGPSGPNGGDLGYFGRGRMVPSFETAAFGLKVGQVSDVVETQFGYHILKVFDIKEARDLPFEEVKEDIRNNLKYEKSSADVEKLVGSLRDAAKIELAKK